MRYDVIIVGAGPAGTSAGYHLAKSGFKVLILEKEKLPRYKPCAGAIAARTLDILGFDISPVLERAIYKVYFTHKFSRGHTITAGSPLAYTVMRDKFDHLLAERAIHAGAEILQEAKVTDVRVNNDGVTVIAGDRQFSGKIVVGADGSKSITAKLLKLSIRRRLVITVHSEVYAESVPLPQNSAWVDIGSIPSGYAWMFPKADHLSMGVGMLQKRARGLKSTFWQCLKNMVPEYKSIKVYVHPLAIWGGRYKLAGNRVVLVGDAGGITDPITGEGIYYAIQSGIISARVISKCLSEGSYDLTEYNSAIWSMLGRPLNCGMKLSALFYAFPRITYRLVLHNEMITTYFTEMMRTSERRSYLDFCKHIRRKVIG